MTKERIEDDFSDSSSAPEITEDDYGIIIDSSGRLKAMILPENAPFKAPKNFARILKVLGINDLGNLGGDATVH